MKRLTLGLVAMILCGVACLFYQAPSEKANASTVAITPEFQIGQGGALTRAKTSRGVEIRNPNEGFALAYDLFQEKTGKPIGKPKGYYVYGDQPAPHLKLICADCKNKQDSATEKGRAALTNDGVLKITSNFKLHSDNRLEVWRIIANISDPNGQDRKDCDGCPKSPGRVDARLNLMEIGYDHRLGLPQPAVVGKLKSPSPNSPNNRIGAQGVGKPTNGGLWRAAFLPGAAAFISIPCDPCPPWCDFEATVAAKGATICVDCPNELTLDQLRARLTREPTAEEIELSRTKGVIQFFREDSLTPVANCYHPIRIETACTPAGCPEFVVRRNETRLICASCPPDSPEFIVRTALLSSIGDVADLRRERSRWPLEIEVRRGEFADWRRRPPRSPSPSDGLGAEQIGESLYLEKAAYTSQQTPGVFSNLVLRPGERAAIKVFYNLH